MTNAKLLIDDVLRPAVQLERHLPDPPPVVWKALTELKKLDQLADWPLAVPEQLQDGHPAGLGQDMKRGQSTHRG